MKEKPVFEGLKVLEIATVLAAPLVGQFFAELGATVIKVENPKTQGDVTRKWLINNEIQEPSAYFTCANLGKYSIALDLQNADEQRIIHELIKKIDILILNLKPGDANKLGLTSDFLLNINPQLIIGEITGYGENSNRTGYDAVIQAEAGFMYLNREPNQLPQKMPVAFMDLMASHQLKQAILIALYERIFTKKGKKVSVSLIEAGISSLANQATAYLIANQNPQPMGSEHPSIFPYGSIFQTADQKFVMLAVGNDKEFLHLCQSIDLEHLAWDERFLNNPKRVENRKELKPILAEKILQKSQKEWITLWNKLKIPCAPVNDVKTILESEYAKDVIFYENGIPKGLKSIAFKGISSNTHLFRAPLFNEHSYSIQDILANK